MDEIKVTTQKPEETKKSFSFFGLLKGLFFLFLIVQFLPDVIFTIRHAAEEALDDRTQVGCVDILGPIVDSRAVTILKKYAEDKKIKGILVRITSPGGLPGCAQALHYEILRIRENKPVAVYIENCCASAAYHMAAAGDYIVATPSALVGNIGAFVEIANIKGLLDDWKVRFNYIQSGKFKTMGSPMKDMSEDERELLQSVSDDTYQQFIKEVAASRELDLTKHLEWADGKIFTGNQAHVLGLIDETGDQQKALDYLKKVLKSETDLRLMTQKAPFSFINLFSGSGEGVDMSGSSSGMESNVGNIMGKALGQVLKAGVLGV